MENVMVKEKRKKKRGFLVLTDVHQKEPGDALYLPHGMPHAVYNLDDTVALTENYLFMGWQSV